MEGMIRDYLAETAARSLFREPKQRKDQISPIDGQCEALNYDENRICTNSGTGLVNCSLPKRANVRTPKDKVGHFNNNPILTDSGAVKLTSKRARTEELDDDERESPKRFKKGSVVSANSARIFIIPEIATLILRHVPVLDLITTCRSVCTIWRDLVDTSLIVREHIAATKASEGIFTPKPCYGEFSYLSLSPTAEDFLELFWRKLLRLYREQGKEADPKSENWQPDECYIDRLYDLYANFLPHVTQITTFPPLPTDLLTERGILLTKATNIKPSKLKNHYSSAFEQKFGLYPCSLEHCLPNVLYLQCFKAYHRLYDNIMNGTEAIRLLGKQRIVHRHNADFLNFWAVYRNEWAVFVGDVTGRDLILEERERMVVERDHRRKSAQVMEFAIFFDMRGGGSVKEKCEQGQYAAISHPSDKEMAMIVE